MTTILRSILLLSIGCLIMVHIISAFHCCQQHVNHPTKNNMAFLLDSSHRRQITASNVGNTGSRRGRRLLGMKLKSKSKSSSSFNNINNNNSQLEKHQHQEQEEQKPKEATIRLTDSGKEVTLISRTVPILNFSVTVWEWKNSAEVVNAYWEAQGQVMTSFGTTQQKSLLDPFGLVSWPGSVLAARELCKHAEIAVKNKNVVVLGAGVGVETQTAAMLGAKRVVATDIHPTTLQQLEYGISRNDRIDDNVVVQTEILDLFATEREQPIPPCDLLIVADVLYSEILASQVCRRCAEALEKNPNIRILITDSQRFVPDFIDELNEALKRVQVSSHVNNENKDDEGMALAAWKVQTMQKFKGSGVIIDEDQTYDVTVQSLWIGL